MYPSGATIVLAMQYMTVVLWLISSFMATNANGEALSVKQNTEYLQSIDEKMNRNTQCTGLGASNAFCTIKTELQYSRYLNTPLTLHDKFYHSGSQSGLPNTNLLAIFKLALEEFNLLSGVRIYWEYTERNIRQWAVKFKLKGEIAITDPYDQADGPTLHNARYLKQLGRQNTGLSNGLQTLLKPQTIRWNLGLNPEDLTMFADVHLNSHMSLSGKFGDESQVGLYFRYAF